MSVKVQIYLKTPEDAAMAVESGADFIGVVSDARGVLTPSIGYEQANAVFDQVPETRTKVVLTIAQNPNEIIELVETLQPDVLHLAGEPLPPDVIAGLRVQIAPTRIMQAIPVNAPAPIDMALAYQSVCDYFILDTNDPMTPDIGATGKTHNWHISAELVQQVRIPVFLAGGLSPDNVGISIKTVYPFGVDSFSHTNIEGRRDIKDPEKVRAFIQAAKSAL